MGHEILRPRVAHYFDTHIGTTVYISELVQALKLEPRQIQNAIANGVRVKFNHWDTRLEVVQRGNAWRWHGNNKKANDGSLLFERIAITKSGVVLVQDENGTVYKLTELD
jgi:hypothetical protein